MSEKLKRRWFRFHLLTLVLLTLVAGVLLYFNWQSIPHNHGDPPLYYERGWPFVMNIGCRGWATDIHWSKQTEGVVLIKVIHNATSPDGLDGTWYISKVLANVAACMVAIAVAAFLSESLIRRREARKTL
jgi:hypothetical protein